MSVYPLLTLLGLRERAKEEAERALAAAAQVLAEAEARRAELEAQLARLRGEREARVQAHHARVLGSGAAAGSLLAMEAYLERLKDAERAQASAVEVQAGVEARARDALACCRARLAEAARELEVLEKHREGWLQARRAEREAREEQAQEEVASARFLSRRRR